MTVAFPPGWQRTPRDDRARGNFNRTVLVPTSYGGTYRTRRGVTFSQALADVQSEIRKTNGSDLRIDHDGQYDKRSGDPLAGKREPDDPAVVVYWKRGSKSYAIACDTYRDRAQNLCAIAKTIEAMRGIERWGAVTGETAFKGLEALPPGRSCWDVLGLPNNGAGASLAMVQEAFRNLVRTAHPDSGGSHEAFVALASARDEALALLGDA